MFDDETSRAHVGTARGQEAHRQLLRLARLRAALDAEIATWLLVARDACVHVELGFGTFLEYVERVLGYRPRTALDRLRVAEALEGLPAIRGALESAELSYSAVREITRVATQETEAAWIDAVEGKTMREIQDLVVGREQGDRPCDPAKPSITPRRLVLELAPDDYALWVQARRALEDDAGERLDDGSALAAMCRGVLDGATEGTRPRHQIAVTVCADCDRATQDAAGQIVAIGPDALALARCDATALRLDEPDAPPTLEIPLRTRRHVERRDRLRCVVPGCRSSRELHLHHLRERAHGGTHEPDNLVLVCGNHHRAIHHGHLLVTGTAPQRLDFRHADGRPYGTPMREPVPAPSRAHVGTLAELEARLQPRLAPCDR